MDNTSTQKANEKRAAYLREWRKKNPEKNKEYCRQYWIRKAEKAEDKKIVDKDSHLNEHQVVLFNFDEDYGKLTIYRSPELPTVKLKVDGVTYEVTNLSLLNERAIEVLMKILENIIYANADEKVTLPIESENTLHIIIDIVMGIKCKAHKSGINGYSWNTGFVVHGVSIHGKYIDYLLDETIAENIRKYAERHKDFINFTDMLIEVSKVTMDNSIQDIFRLSTKC